MTKNGHYDITVYTTDGNEYPLAGYMDSPFRYVSEMNRDAGIWPSSELFIPRHSIVKIRFKYVMNEDFNA